MSSHPKEHQPPGLRSPGLRSTPVRAPAPSEDNTLLYIIIGVAVIVILIIIIIIVVARSNSASTPPPAAGDMGGYTPTGQNPAVYSGAGGVTPAPPPLSSPTPETGASAPASLNPVPGSVTPATAPAAPANIAMFNYACASPTKYLQYAIETYVMDQSQGKQSLQGLSPSGYSNTPPVNVSQWFVSSKPVGSMQCQITYKTQSLPSIINSSMMPSTTTQTKTFTLVSDQNNNWYIAAVK